jgi:hypothetical protein
LTFIDDFTVKSNCRHWLLGTLNVILLLFFSPDESEKPFEINCYFFPEYKERLKSSYALEKKQWMKKRNSAGNSSKKRTYKKNALVS